MTCVYIADLVMPIHWQWGVWGWQEYRKYLQDAVLCPQLVAVAIFKEGAAFCTLDWNAKIKDLKNTFFLPWGWLVGLSEMYWKFAMAFGTHMKCSPREKLYLHGDPFFHLTPSSGQDFTFTILLLLWPNTCKTEATHCFHLVLALVCVCVCQCEYVSQVGAVCGVHRRQTRVTESG